MHEADLTGEIEKRTNLNDLGLLETPEIDKALGYETPEQKQAKNIVIALRGIEKELHEINRNLRSRK